MNKSDCKRLYIRLVSVIINFQYIVEYEQLIICFIASDSLVIESRTTYRKKISITRSRLSSAYVGLV